MSNAKTIEAVICCGREEAFDLRFRKGGLTARHVHAHQFESNFITRRFSGVYFALTIASSAIFLAHVKQNGCGVPLEHVVVKSSETVSKQHPLPLRSVRKCVTIQL